MFGRRSQDEQSGAGAVAEEPNSPRDPQAPKGRPTPKRSDARSQRRAAARPAGRKEANQRAREARREELARQREALARGDERHLPRRDKGPVRRFARDYVDSRWHAGELFLPFAVVILVLSALRIDLYLVLWLVLIVAIVGQSIITGARLRGELARRFPDRERRGAVGYALMRTLQLRRMRLPKPQVKRGEFPT